MRPLRATLALALVPLALAACGSSSSSSSDAGAAAPTSSGAASASSSSTSAVPSSESSSASTSSASTTSAASSGAALIQTASLTVAGSAKTVLTNSQGLTLYIRTGDTATTVTCTGGCATNWPPVLLPSGTPSGSSAVTGTLSVLAGPNGRQVLYNGHPLYGWIKDHAPGDATGQGVGGFSVATPDLPVAA